MYKKKSQSLMKHWDFMLVDIVSLQASFLLAYVIFNGFDLPYDQKIYKQLVILFILADITTFVFVDTLKNVLKRDIIQGIQITLKHACVVEMIVIVYLFLIKERSSYSRKVVIVTGIIYFIFSVILRLCYKKYFLNKVNSKGKRSLMVVTTSDRVEKVIEHITTNNYEAFHISGIAITDKNMIGETIAEIPVVADKDTMYEFACREWIDEVFVNYESDTEDSEVILEKFIEMGIVVHIRLWRSTARHGAVRFVEHLGNYTVLTASINAASPAELFMKRALDICGGLVGTLITGILVLILGPMIYLQSPGPIFFSQERIGKNGKRFKMYKFRSMYMDAEERKKELMKENRVKDGMMFKLDFDPRIIGSKKYPDGRVKKGIGNYIRDLSLDEFPQFLNILKGDMSLVGTRPPTVDEWEKYELHHRARLSTKPGLTGMWQVSGRSNITDFEEVVKLDTQYISQWNFWLDIKILLKTVLVVLKKEGSM